MKAMQMAIVAAVVISAAAQNHAPVSDKERLIGAWRLISITGPDGRSVSEGVPQGMLMYTRDGHISVQLMYPEAANAQSNEYVKNGYEASFGSYDMNEATHVLTHHVQGSVTRGLLVGKDRLQILLFIGKVGVPPFRVGGVIGRVLPIFVMECVVSSGYACTPERFSVLGSCVSFKCRRGL
jgi:hypothetical protein